MRVDPTRPRGAYSSVVPPPPSSTGADVAGAFGAATVDADVPPLTTSDDSDIQRTLDHFLTIQAAHGQILVDVLDEIRALRAKHGSNQARSPKSVHEPPERLRYDPTYVECPNHPK